LAPALLASSLTGSSPPGGKEDGRNKKKGVEISFHLFLSSFFSSFLFVSLPGGETRPDAGQAGPGQEVGGGLIEKVEGFPSFFLFLFSPLFPSSSSSPLFSTFIRLLGGKGRPGAGRANGD